MKAFLERKLQSIWFRAPRNLQDRLFMACARPVSALAEKKILRLQSTRRLDKPPVPVIVVGNLVVGGSGKTPISIALAESLKRRGLKAGLIASGYGSPAYELQDHARLVQGKSRPAVVGDEPVLLAKSTGLPVAASGKRRIALEALIKAHPDLQAVISDDGLQHAALPRSIELCVVDARGFGNGEVLPAGPLREPVAGLANIDAFVLNEVPDNPGFDALIAGAARPGEPALAAIVAKPRFSVTFSEMRFLPFAQWQNRETSKENFRAITAKELIEIASGRDMCALAGTARPEAFFAALRKQGLSFKAVALGDHASFDGSVLKQIVAPVIIMTEKDAVKWPAGRRQMAWVAIRETHVDPGLIDWLMKRLKP